MATAILGGIASGLGALIGWGILLGFCWLFRIYPFSGEFGTHRRGDFF